MGGSSCRPYNNFYRCVNFTNGFDSAFQNCNEV